MAIRSDFAEGMQQTMYDWFYEDYDKFEFIYSKYFNVKESGAGWEQETTAVGPGKLVESEENDPYAFRDPTEADTVITKNRTFKDGVAFSMESVEDHQKTVENAIRDYAKQWADSYKWAKEDFYRKFLDFGGINAGNDVFNNTLTGNVTDASGDVVYDGESWFNLSGDVATRLSLAGTGYFNGHALDLTATNFETVWNIMTGTNNRTENDEVIEIMPNILVVPTQLEFTARRILNSTNIPGKTDNDVNVLNSIVELIVNPYLSDTNAWFLGVRGKGIVARERKDPELRFFRDEINGGFKATINARFGGAVTNWRYWSGSNFSTA